MSAIATRESTGSLFFYFIWYNVVNHLNLCNLKALWSADIRQVRSYFFIRRQKAASFLYFCSFLKFGHFGTMFKHFGQFGNVKSLFTKFLSLFFVIFFFWANFIGVNSQILNKLVIWSHWYLQVLLIYKLHAHLEEIEHESCPITTRPGLIIPQVAFCLSGRPVWPEKNRQMSIKVA